ncbi:MAG TPA: RagB/SusD family nutrient uptake outer membrane protein, partial [Puia sp.]|nr:RagB/SusD family nutrient uptake outer membrane protein [Puia sp.]
MIKISAFVTVVLISVTGCKKYLDLTPQSEITDPAYWQTANDFRLAANWFYNQTLPDPHYDGNNNDDNMSEMAFGQSSINAVSSGTYVPAEQDDNWDSAYSSIRNANKLIQEGLASSLKTDVQPFLGEGYFFRAFDYFNLLKLYGGVPIINKVLLPTDSAVFTGRASRDVVMDSILND